MSLESEQAEVRGHERRAIKMEAVQDQMKKKFGDRIANKPELETMSVEDFFDHGSANISDGAFYGYLETEGFITPENEAEMDAKTVEEFIAALQEAKEMLGGSYEVKGDGGATVAEVAEEQSGKTAAVLAEIMGEELSLENREFLADFRRAEYTACEDILREAGQAEGMPTFDEWVKAMKDNKALDALRLSAEVFVLTIEPVLEEDGKVKSYRPGLREVKTRMDQIGYLLPRKAVWGEDIPRKA